MPTDFAPTEHAKDLRLAIEAKLPAETIARMALSFKHDRTWSPQAPVSPAGHTLAQAWLLALVAYDPPDAPSLSSLEVALGGSSLAEILQQVPSGRKCSLGEQVLECLREGPPSYRVRDFLWSESIFSALDEAILAQFRKDRHYTGAPGKSATRDDIFRLAIEESQLGAAQVLMDRGWSWVPAGGRAPGQYIKSVEAWDFFLATGGRPAQEVVHVDYDENRERMPLWKYLLKTESGNDALRGKIEEWAAAHAGQELEQKALADYWKNLDRYGTIQDVMGRARARKDWPSIRNEAGENVAMVALRHHPSALAKIAAVARARPLLSQVDHAGRSLWHHLLVQGAKASASDWALAAEHAPPRPDPGEGMLAVLARCGEFEQKALPIAEHLAKMATGRVPSQKGRIVPEDWWAGSHDQMMGVAKALSGSYWGSNGSSYGGFSPADLVLRLVSLVRAFPPPDTLPAPLLGVLAFAELVAGPHYSSPNQKDPFSLCDRFLDNGANLPEELVTKNMREMVDALPSQAQARFQKLCLASTLPQPTRATPKARF